MSCGGLGISGKILWRLLRVSGLCAVVRLLWNVVNKIYSTVIKAVLIVGSAMLDFMTTSC